MIILNNSICSKLKFNSIFVWYLTEIQFNQILKLTKSTNLTDHKNIFIYSNCMIDITISRISIIFTKLVGVKDEKPRVEWPQRNESSYSLERSWTLDLGGQSKVKPISDLMLLMRLGKFDIIVIGTETCLAFWLLDFRPYLEKK